MRPTPMLPPDACDLQSPELKPVALSNGPLNFPRKEPTFASEPSLIPALQPAGSLDTLRERLTELTLFPKLRV